MYVCVYIYIYTHGLQDVFEAMRTLRLPDRAGVAGPDCINNKKA